MSYAARILAVGLTCALVLSVGVAPTHATTMVYYGTEKLLEDCSFVVLGRVVGVECSYHDAVYGGNHHEIYTFTTIAIDRSWGKGSPTGTIVIEEAGGMVGTRVSTVDGLPQYSLGQEVLVFVERRPDGHFKTFGMFLGALTVQREPGGRAFLVRPALPAGTGLVDAGFDRDLIEADSLNHFDLEAFMTTLTQRTEGKGR